MKKIFYQAAYVFLFLNGFAGIMFGIMELNQLFFYVINFDQYSLFRGIIMIIGGFALLKWGFDIKNDLNNQD